MHNLGIQICAQITASQSTFPITDTNDWPDLWGLWHHYYAQAFYLGRYFDVQRFEIYNEPNASGGPTQTNFLLRLQFASDAISNALADVNSLYGKTLSPVVLAPTLAGGAVGIAAIYSDQVVTLGGQPLTASIVTLSALGAIVMYVMSLLSLFRLRRREPGLERPFRTPGYPLFPQVALALALVSLLAIAWDNRLLAAIFLATGLAGAAVTAFRFRRGRIGGDDALLGPAAVPSDGQSVSR